MRRLAFGLLVALALGIVARPLLDREVFTFRDHTDYFQPLRWFTSTALRSAQLPLWNPYSASGEPWLANPQTAVFYPPAWLFLVLPFETAYMLFLALHLALLGCGALLLFARRASLGAALVGAVALMLCGPTLSLLDVQNNLTTFAWLPLVIWCGAARAPAMGSAAAMAMSFLAGEPFFAAVGALIFAVVRRRDVVDVAAQSFALAAVQLVPFLGLLRGSDRVGASPAEVLRDAMPLRDWLRVAVPPSVSASGFDAALGQHFIPIVYVGLITSALAIAGALFAWRRLGGWLALLAAAIVFSTAQGAGLLAHLPLALFRYPARLVPLGALAVAAMAVEGWEVLDGKLAPLIRRFAPPSPRKRGEGAHATSALAPRSGERVAEGRVRGAFAAFVAIAIAAELLILTKPLLVTAPMNWKHPVPYASGVGRDAKLVRLGDPQLIATNRRAWIGGYLNLYERRFDAWTAAPLVSRRYEELYERALNDRSLSLLSSMSAGYLITEGGVFRNARARPLAYAENAAPSVLAFGPSFVHAVIELPAPSTLIVTQQRSTGWSVDVDGRRATSVEGGDFLAVQLPSGKHDVLWRYRSVPLVVGAVLTLLAIVRMLLPKKFVKR